MDKNQVQKMFDSNLTKSEYMLYLYFCFWNAHKIDIQKVYNQLNLAYTTGNLALNKLRSKNLIRVENVNQRLRTIYIIKENKVS